jgi:hypothetical protein
VTANRQTNSFIENSIEAGILLGGRQTIIDIKKDNVHYLSFALFETSDIVYPPLQFLHPPETNCRSLTNSTGSFRPVHSAHLVCDFDAALQMIWILPKTRCKDK